MRVRTAITGICSLLILCTAHVQTRDEFNGGFASNLQWSWRVPLNNPECTLDPTAVTFTSDALQIQMRDGGMFSFYNMHRDVPNLRVVGPVPSNWYIATAFRTDWSVFADYNYVQAGLVVFTDAANYFQLLVTRDANTPGSGNQNVYGSTNIETNDNFAWGERVTNVWIPDNQWIGVKVAHDPSDNTIKLYYRRSTDADWVLFDGFNGGVYDSQSWQYGAIVSLITNPNVRIGVYTDNAGGGYQNAFEFDYFETNIPVVVAGDIDASGCVDDSDLLAVLFAFGSTGECLDEDTNLDGTVDDSDLLTVLFNFGTGC
jgi:hypothetical protein